MTENIDLREKVDLIPNRCFNKESQFIDSKFGVGISTFRLALKKSQSSERECAFALLAVLSDISSGHKSHVGSKGYG